MAVVLQVRWVEQSSQSELHRRIRYIGGQSGQLQWKHTQADAVASLERGLFAYYVERDRKALKLNVFQSADGNKYLTVPEAEGQANMLLDLPGFPPPNPSDRPNPSGT